VHPEGVEAVGGGLFALMTRRFSASLIGMS
jgi:hypothetical protein